MEMTMTCSLRQASTMSLTRAFGETIGDIPLYSLHRIKTLLRHQPPKLGQELHVLLVRELIAASRRYQEESGNRRWSCLTSNNLVEALDGFDAEIGQVVSQAEAMPDDSPQAKQAIIGLLRNKQVEAVGQTKAWFDERSEQILYDTSGKIPWAVVCRLRQNLSAWIAGAANPFGADIEDAIVEIARGEGIRSTDPGDAWEAMGGKIFRQSRKHK